MEDINVEVHLAKSIPLDCLLGYRGDLHLKYILVCHRRIPLLISGVLAVFRRHSKRL